MARHLGVCLILSRNIHAAQLFERLLSLHNDVSLLSEQYDPRARWLAGNMPQAFLHLALVNSASNLGHYRKSTGQCSQHPVDDGAAQEKLEVYQGWKTPMPGRDRRCIV